MRFVVKKLDAAGSICVGKLANGGTGWRGRVSVCRRVGERAGVESVGHGSVGGGIVERAGIGGGGGVGSFALGSETWGSIVTPAALLWGHWTAADVRVSEQGGGDGAVVDAGQDRADVPVRGGLRDMCWRRLRAGIRTIRDRRGRVLLLCAGVCEGEQGDHDRVRAAGPGVDRGSGRWRRCSPTPMRRSGRWGSR
jgi:hypothetical protein